MTAGDVTEALHRRYNRPSQGREGEQYICLEEARAGAGFAGNGGRCDFLAINTWPSRGLELIGHEIKVSMTDWKAELVHPEKAERFARYCRRWYVVMPSELARRVKDEVPPGWGLLSVSPSGRVTQTQAARSREAEDVPGWWWVGWLAQVDRQHKRRLAGLVERRMAEATSRLRERFEAEFERRLRVAPESHQRLRASAEALKAATGIDLERASSYQLEDLARAWRVVQCPSPAMLAHDLRRIADALEGSIGPTRG